MEPFLVRDCYVVDDKFVVKVNTLGEDDRGFDRDVPKQLLGLPHHSVLQGAFSLLSLLLWYWGGHESMQVFAPFHIFPPYCGKLVASHLSCPQRNAIDKSWKSLVTRVRDVGFTVHGLEWDLQQIAMLLVVWFALRMHQASGIFRTDGKLWRRLVEMVDLLISVPG